MSSKNYQDYCNDYALTTIAGVVTAGSDGYKALSKALLSNGYKAREIHDIMWLIRAFRLLAAIEDDFFETLTALLDEQKPQKPRPKRQRPDKPPTCIAECETCPLRNLCT